MRETPPSLSVHHLAVVVRDLDLAEAFYAGVLGLPVMRRWTDETGAPRSVWLELGGGAFLAVERAGADGPTRADGAPGWHCVALGIAPSERDAWRRRLAASGVAIERESAYSMYARDPEGNLVALSHYPHPQAEAG
ncbi:VOC family protein [Sorangium sp. So ce1335]|uniref:VOC family protein n=1 Tax=Sorangium sp. So ce1335 TaxID=3133335 RepID=UPI003F63D810